MHHQIVNNENDLKRWILSVLPELNWKNNYLAVIKVFRKRRTISQNNTYWMWMTALANHIGDDKESVHEGLVEALGDVTKDTLHEAFKRKYLPWNEVHLPGGLSYWEPGHSPDSDTKEFSEYMNKIHIHAYQFFGMHLPYPDDSSFNEFCQQYNVLEKL